MLGTNFLCLGVWVLLPCQARGSCAWPSLPCVRSYRGGAARAAVTTASRLPSPSLPACGPLCDVAVSVRSPGSCPDSSCFISASVPTPPAFVTPGAVQRFPNWCLIPLCSFCPSLRLLPWRPPHPSGDSSGHWAWHGGPSPPTSALAPEASPHPCARSQSVSLWFLRHVCGVDVTHTLSSPPRARCPRYTSCTRSRNILFQRELCGIFCTLFCTFLHSVVGGSAGRLPLVGKLLGSGSRFSSPCAWLQPGPGR